MQNKTFASRLGTWFRNLPIKDPINRGMAALVQVLLLGFMFIVALSGVLNVALPSSIPWQGTLFRTFLFIFIIGIPLILLRRGYFRGSVVLIIALLLVLETYAVVSTNLRSITETLAFF